MFRAQGILKEWKKHSEWVNGCRYCGLYEFIEIQYRKYCDLSKMCSEKYLRKGEWLRQVIIED